VTKSMTAGLAKTAHRSSAEIGALAAGQSAALSQHLKTYHEEKRAVMAKYRQQREAWEVEHAAWKATLPWSFRPRFVNGRWCRAVLSGRRIAKIRKDFLLRSEEWKWDPPAKPKRPVFFKGLEKREKRLQERLAKIGESMSTMDQRVEEYRKTMREKRKRPSDPVWVMSKGKLTSAVRLKLPRGKEHKAALNAAKAVEGKTERKKNDKAKSAKGKAR